MTGVAIVTLAKGYMGLPYNFGVVVPKNDKTYRGAFDCAELAAYLIFQKYGKLFGCNTADVKKAATADAYTGYFNRDLLAGLLIEISIEEAARTPGAFVLRVAVGKSIGHIALSRGNGLTYEAHSTAKGCIPDKIDGRRWDKAFLIKGVEYTQNMPVKTAAPAIVFRLKRPFMEDPFIDKLQRALQAAGYDPNGIDGKFGEDTQGAVVNFQKANGLTADGEVMPVGPTAKALGIAYD